MLLNSDDWDALTEPPAHPLTLADFALRLITNNQHVHLALRLDHAETGQPVALAIRVPHTQLFELAKALEAVSYDLSYDHSDPDEEPPHGLLP